MKNFGAGYDATLIMLAIIFILGSAAVAINLGLEIFGTGLLVCATAILISIRRNAFRN